jgi:tetratricopeptide (TPR) repeat protein
VALALVTLLSSVAGCGSNDPIQQAREQLAAGKVTESIELLRKLIAAEPDNPELLYLYGRSLVKAGQPGLAAWPLRKAMEDPVWFERSAMIVATIEAAGGNMENAVNVYSDILEKNPDNMGARIQRANVCARSPRLFEEALAEVDRILEIAPDEIGAYKPRILAYLGMNDSEHAGQAMEELGARIDERDSDENPIRGWYCATMAIFAAESGDESLARERWEVCVEKFPAHSNVVGQAIEFHSEQGELSRALEIAEAAFAADSSVQRGYRLVLADLLRRVGRPDDAGELLMEAVATDNKLNRAAALLALAEHYKTVGNPVAAVETLERGLKLTEKTMGPQPNLMFALADLLIQIGDDERALELTKQMTVAAHRSLVRARIAHERKHYVKALKLYEETTRLWPENPYAPYHAGRAAMSAGLFDRAFENFLLAVRVEDGATDARCRAGRLLDAEGKPNSAVEMMAGGRAGTSPECQLLVVELLARMYGAAAGLKRASQMSDSLPAYYGRAVAAAAKGTRERASTPAAWTIVEPVLSLDFPPINHLPVLRAAVESAPGDEELTVVGPFILRAVESDPNSAAIRETEGMFFERTGKPDQAETSYRLAFEADPESVSTILRLARITAGSDPQGSTQLIEQALILQETSLKPLDAELFLAAVAELPESSGAAVLFGSALELAPASGPIALRLGMLLEASGGQAERIAKLARRAIRFQQGQKAKDLLDRVEAKS